MKRAAGLLLTVLLSSIWLSTPPAAYTSPLVGFSSAAYSLLGGIVEESSPTLADLDGDGVPEILVGTTALDGTTGQRDRPTYLAALKGDGSTWFQVQVGAPIKSAPAVGDIDGDGAPEVVVTVGGDAADPDHHGEVRAYNRFGNQLLWFYRTQDHHASGDGYSEGIFSSPTLCDVDGDGDMEIAFGSWDQRIYLLDHEGNSLWDDPLFPGPGIYNADTGWSTAACADLNQDGYKEIIIGADIEGGGTLPDGTQPEDGGYLYVIDKDGNILVRRYITEAIYSSPAVGDIDGDGDLEIVVGTSFTFWQLHPPDPQPYVYAFDTTQVFGTRHYSDPAKLPYLPGWPRPTAYPGFSSPALADLDGDGDLEVIIGSGEPNGASGSHQCSDSASDPDCYGAIYAWHHDGTPVAGFPMWPKDSLAKNSFIRSSPTVADVDNDDDLEILFAMLWDVIVLGPGGTQEYTLHTTWSVFGSPAVGDTDDDGKVDIWIGGSEFSNSSKGYLWHFESDTEGLGDAPWPMFHHDAQHTGRYPAPPHLDGIPDYLHIMHEYEDGPFESSSLLVTNRGEGEIAWMFTSYPPTVTLASLFGTVDGMGQIVPITISVSSYATGTYALGDIVLTGTVENGIVAGSPVTIPVTLYVGPIHQVFLPTVSRGD
jgi:hypothetical protein